MKQKDKKLKSNKSPLEFFFSLGDKVTKGDPKKQSDFNYYLLWVVFIAFLTVIASNLNKFIKSIDTSSIANFFSNSDFSSLGWSVVVFALLWFQYNNLKLSRESRKMQSKMQNDLEKVESVDEMMKSFSNK